MFYLTVEEYMMKNRQRELMKELELKRQLRDSLENKPDNGSYFRTKAGDWLRNLASVFRADASGSIDNKASLNCVVC